MKALPYKAIRTRSHYVEVAVTTVYNINIHIACFRVGYEGNIVMDPGLIGGATEPTAQKMRPHVMVDDVVSIASDSQQTDGQLGSASGWNAQPRPGPVFQLSDGQSSDAGNVFGNDGERLGGALIQSGQSHGGVFAPSQNERLFEEADESSAANGFAVASAAAGQRRVEHAIQWTSIFVNTLVLDENEGDLRRGNLKVPGAMAASARYLHETALLLTRPNNKSVLKRKEKSNKLF